MRKIVGVTAAAALAASGAASAASLGSSIGLHDAGNALDPIENAQLVRGGYNYCWYDDGWHGPGWYVCDYGPWVYDRWWGGPLGWHHWRRRGPHLHGAFH